MSAYPGDISVPRPLPDVLVELVARRFRALGQPMRIRLLDELERHGEASVQALADELSATQQNASRHLGVLTQAGLLARRQDGRVVWYRLAHEYAFSPIMATAADVMTELRRHEQDE